MESLRKPKDPMEEYLAVPGATPTLPVAVAKDESAFTLPFISEAIKYFDSFHWQLGGDHAMYYNTHVGEFMTTALSWPSGEGSHLERSIQPGLGGITFEVTEGDPAIPLDDYVMNGEARVQGFMMVHHGKVVYEQYPGMRPSVSHILFSVTKTTVGLMMAMLQAEGKVDVDQMVTHYIPELKGTVWDTIRISNLLSMSTGVKGIEELFPRPGGDQTGTLLDPHSTICRFFYSVFGKPNADGKVEDWIDVVRSVQADPDVKPGTKMQYSSMLTHLLTVTVEKISNKRFTRVFEDRVWSKIGARNPAEFATCPDGTVLALGFLALALEDLARYGLIYTPSYTAVSKERVVSQEVFDIIQNGGDPDAYRGTGDYERGFKYFGEETYKNSYQWDSLFADGAMWKHGNLAQGLYVDPKRDVVGVYLSSNPLTGVWDRSPGYIRAAAKKLAGF